jgi:hypothetical protein
VRQFDQASFLYGMLGVNMALSMLTLGAEPSLQREIKLRWQKMLPCQDGRVQTVSVFQVFNPLFPMKRWNAYDNCNTLSKLTLLLSKNSIDLVQSDLSSKTKI